MKIFNDRQVRELIGLHLQRVWLASQLIRSLHNPEYDWFEVKLFNLIFKADRSNQKKIEKGFPQHMVLYRQYMTKGERWLKKVYNL